MTVGRTSRPRGLRVNAGFTLMELVLVLIVISLVMALAAPSLRGFFIGRQTADVARSLLSLTRLAQSQAISQGRPCRLNVDATTGAYWVTIQQAGAYIPLDWDLGRRFKLPEDVSLVLQHEAKDSAASLLAKVAPVDQADYVQFYPNGRSDIAVIKITGKDGEVIHLSCGSATEPFRIASVSEEH